MTAIKQNHFFLVHRFLPDQNFHQYECWLCQPCWMLYKSLGLMYNPVIDCYTTTKVVVKKVFCSLSRPKSFDGEVISISFRSLVTTEALKTDLFNWPSDIYWTTTWPKLGWSKKTNFGQFVDELSHTYDDKYILEFILTYRCSEHPLSVLRLPIIKMFLIQMPCWHRRHQDKSSDQSRKFFF